MKTEVLMLGLSVLLGLLQILIPTLGPVSDRGLRWAMGPRDAIYPPMAGIWGRLDRALRNFLETFPLFVASLLAVIVTGRSNALTVLGAELYFWARLVYVPTYALGIPILRTLIWMVSVVGILFLVAALF